MTAVVTVVWQYSTGNVGGGGDSGSSRGSGSGGTGVKTVSSSGIVETTNGNYSGSGIGILEL